MFHSCSIIPMNIIIGLLPNSQSLAADSQSLAANERDVGMQGSLVCTITETHLKPHETLFGALWLVLVPYLNIGTRTG